MTRRLVGNLPQLEDLAVAAGFGHVIAPQCFANVILLEHVFMRQIGRPAGLVVEQRHQDLGDVLFSVMIAPSSAAARGAPLCPAGHLPHTGGD